MKISLWCPTLNTLLALEIVQPCLEEELARISYKTSKSSTFCTDFDGNKNCFKNHSHRCCMLLLERRDHGDVVNLPCEGIVNIR